MRPDGRASPYWTQNRDYSSPGRIRTPARRRYGNARTAANKNPHSCATRSGSDAAMSIQLCRSRICHTASKMDRICSRCNGTQVDTVTRPPPRRASAVLTNIGEVLIEPAQPTAEKRLIDPANKFFTIIRMPRQASHRCAAWKNTHPEPRRRGASRHGPPAKPATPRHPARGSTI